MFLFYLLFYKTNIFKSYVPIQISFGEDNTIGISDKSCQRFPWNLLNFQSRCRNQNNRIERPYLVPAENDKEFKQFFFHNLKQNPKSFHQHH